MPNSMGMYTVAYGEGDEIFGEYTYGHTYTATGHEVLQLGVTLESFHDPAVSLSVFFVKCLIFLIICGHKFARLTR